MATLMDDPVELPSSKTVIDRITISKFNYSLIYSLIHRTTFDE
jgi:U-box domain